MHPLSYLDRFCIIGGWALNLVSVFIFIFVLVWALVFVFVFVFIFVVVSIDSWTRVVAHGPMTPMRVGYVSLCRVQV